MYLYKNRAGTSRLLFTPLIDKNQKHGLSDDDVKTILDDFRCGDYTRLPELLDAYIHLLRNIASQYASLAEVRVGNIGEDLLSTAILTFIEHCYKLDKLKDDGLIGFLTCRVHTALANYVAGAYLIPIPRGSYYKANKESQFHIEQLVEIDNVGEHYKAIDRKQDHVKYIELEEIVNQAIITRRDRIVMDMKRQGYSLDEIAERIDRSTSTVSKIIDAMKERICEKLNS